MMSLVRIFYQLVLILVCGSSWFAWSQIADYMYVTKWSAAAVAVFCFLVLEIPVHRMMVLSAIRRAERAKANELAAAARVTINPRSVPISVPVPASTGSTAL